MRLTTALVVACLLGAASPAAAQTWRDAYARQDYAAAARLLHADVLELPDGDNEPDPEAAERLGDMYARGLGVQTDGVLACAILRHASFSATIRLGPDHATTARLNASWKAQCGTLGVEARAEAEAMVGCYAFDVPAETFYIDPARSVQTTRMGLRVLSPQGVVDVDVGPSGCNRQVALVRYAPVLAPSPRVPGATRHFIELFAWTSMYRDGRPVRVLSWTLVEVVGAAIKDHEHEILLETTTASWPPSYPSDALPSTVFSASADGGVTWRFSPSPSRSGTLPGVAR